MHAPLSFARLGATALLALSLAGLAACGQAPEPAASHVLEGGSAATLAGTWAKQMIFTSDSSALGISTSNKVERLLVVRATSDGDRLVTTEELCKLNTFSSSVAKVSFPDALRRILPVRHQTFTVADAAGQITLSAPTAVEVLGARLDDAAGDTLPRSDSDPRVIDQDLDGHPGVTVQVSGRVVLVNIDARIYLTQRTLLEESGAVRDAQTIAGKIRWSMEQYTLGSDSRILARLSPTITPRSEQSEFTMRRVDEGATCASLEGRFGGLFTTPRL